MDLRFNTDNDYAVFKDELKYRLKNREKSTAAMKGAKPAAVMMILMNKDKAAHVFLTKRTQNVSTHKGQVSFPGGAREKGDDNILRTALRETYEETGINPDHIEIIGKFDEYISISNFHVSTFVGSIDYPYEYQINTDEIEVFMEAPLSIFCDKENQEKGYYKNGNNDLEIYCYFFKGFSIWGLTARILTEFANKVLY